MYRAIFTEAVQHHFGDRSVTRSYRLYLVALLLAILAFWPTAQIGTIIRFGERPAAFTLAMFVTISFAVTTSFTAATARSRRRLPSEEQWLRHAKATPLSLFGGTILFAAFRHLVLALLSLPPLIAALAVSGITPESGVAALAAALSFSFAVESTVRTFYVALPHRPFIRTMMLSLLAVCSLFLSASVAPTLNPVIVLQSIIAGDGASSLLNPDFGTGAFRESALVGLGASATLSAIAYLASLVLLSRSTRSLR